MSLMTHVHFYFELETNESKDVAIERFEQFLSEKLPDADFEYGDIKVEESNELFVQVHVYFQDELDCEEAQRRISQIQKHDGLTIYVHIQEQIVNE